MTTPQWVTRIAGEVARRYDTSVPPIKWRRSRKYELSSGHCYYKHYIVVTAGNDPVDRRATVLHELAHWVCEYRWTPEDGRRVAHSADFWRVAFDLFEEYGVPRAHVVKREGAYKVGAMREAERRGWVPKATRAARSRGR